MTKAFKELKKLERQIFGFAVDLHTIANDKERLPSDRLKDISFRLACVIQARAPTPRRRRAGQCHTD